MKPLQPEQLPSIGWREWLSLPELGISWIKAKIDTGARSSTLHAFDLEPFHQNGTSMLRFKVHPHQRNNKDTITAEAEFLEERHVRSSTGHTQLRPVIITIVDLNGLSWPIELTLASRDQMGFRMLLGRQAVRQRFLVDAGHSFLWGLGPQRNFKPFRTKSL
jgi:hypothetical protein